MDIRDKIRFARTNGLRFTALRILARFIYPEFRLRYNSQDWLNDPMFNKNLHLFCEARGRNSGRGGRVSQLLPPTKPVPGDPAECGVFQGPPSYIICAFAEAARLRRTHHVFDPFEGLSEPAAIDGRHWRKHD